MAKDYKLPCSHLLTHGYCAGSAAKHSNTMPCQLFNSCSMYAIRILRNTATLADKDS